MDLTGIDATEGPTVGTVDSPAAIRPSDHAARDELGLVAIPKGIGAGPSPSPVAPASATPAEGPAGSAGGGAFAGFGVMAVGLLALRRTARRHTIASEARDQRTS